MNYRDAEQTMDALERAGQPCTLDYDERQGFTVRIADGEEKGDLVLTTDGRGET